MSVYRRLSIIANDRSAIMLCLAIVTVITFLPVLTCEFINYDDPSYVYENRWVKDGLTIDGIRWALTATDMSNWHPLTWISYMLDSQLYGIAPHGFHATNLLLHIITALLLFSTLKELTGENLRSAFVAALFALHPLHVESVAWISERKDLLCAMFFMFTLFTYSKYAVNHAKHSYFTVLAAFSAGLMSKPMIVTMPLLLLMIDWWPLERFKKEKWQHLLLEKLPFILLAACISIVTIKLQHQSGALASLDIHPFTSRISTAFYAYSQYLLKTFLPIKLAFFYPNRHLSQLNIASGAALLVALSILATRHLSQRPYLAVGWGWFVIGLLPVIGLFQVGIQSHADRYTYLPLIGIFIAISWLLTELLYDRHRRILLTTALASLCISAILTFRQTLLWKDSFTLYKHTLAVTDNNYTVHYNFGVELDRIGRTNDAATQLRASTRIAPEFIQGHYSLGIVLAKSGQIDEAISSFRTVIKKDAGHEDAYRQLAYYLVESGKKAEAAYYYKQLLHLDPGDNEARIRLESLTHGL